MRTFKFWRPSSLRELGQDRRVVGRPLPAARLAVYPRPLAARRQRLRDPHVVYAQARVATERALPVVPPREVPAARVVQPEGVGEAPPAHLLKPLALGLAEEDAAAPERGVMHVSVFGRDVEVAADKHIVVGPELLVEVRAQSLEPFELEAVL